MLYIPMKQSMKHAPGKTGLQPGTGCIFILALYFGLCVWGNICFVLIIPCLLAACFKRTAVTKKNKCVEAQNPFLAFIVEFETQMERKTSTCGHAH